ncbi:MAG TPA: carbohydrate ABC transporter permease [Planctomycetota bacterium]|jgi:raffinose/stachyose/melibiose transport system permease protein
MSAQSKIQNPKSKIKRWPAFEVAMLVCGIIFVLPCLLAILNAFKTNSQIIESPLALPTSVNLSNFRYIFQQLKVVGLMINTLLMCVLVITSLVIVGSMAAYSLTRRRMLTGSALRIFFLAGLTIPFQIIMIPLLKEFGLLGINQTYLALFLHHVSWGLPLCIFIYSAFMMTIPKELEEAAAIDGCGQVEVFWRIVFPLLRPCTITIIIFWGLWIWNDFMQAFIVMGPDRGKLVFVQLWKLVNNPKFDDRGRMFAGVVVLSAPVTVLYILMQRQFVKGLTAGSGK